MRHVTAVLALAAISGCESPTESRRPLVFEVTAASVVANLVTTTSVPAYHIDIPYRLHNTSGVAVHVADCPAFYLEKSTAGAWQRVWPPMDEGRLCSLELRPPLEPGAVRTGTFVVVVSAVAPPGSDLGGSYRLGTSFSASLHERLRGVATSNQFLIVPDGDAP